MKHITFSYHHIKHYKRQTKSKKTLWISLALTLFFAVVEFIGGLLSQSLALLSDSFHMFSDVLALVLSMIAVHFAAKRPNDRFTYGYVRLEILVAFLNGLILMLIACGIVFEAFKRLVNPVEINFTTMLSIAVLGLLINVILAGILMSSLKTERNLNIRSALWHFWGDLLNSVGVIAAALLIKWTGISAIDALVSFIIGGVIFIGGYAICKKAFLILMEATPPELDVQKIRQTVLEIDEVEDLHEFHLWALTDDTYSLSFHVILKDYSAINDYEIVKNISSLLKTKYRIEHVTIQIENPQINEH